MTFIPRKEQQEVLSYTGGTMGISAVPGSGKTFTLSLLAADLIEKLIRGSDKQEPDQEILIVTFSNAAALNFSARIAGFLAERGLLPGIGYRVCTLHSMALEIIRGRTQQLGIAEDFTVLDEIGSDALVQRAVDLWMDSDRRMTFDRVVDPRLKNETQDEKYREKWRDDVTGILRNVISQAKDYHITPEELRKNMELTDDRFARPLLEMVCDIYGYYQTQLRNYPAMDFADLMFYAYRLLASDPAYLAYLQYRWPYILEDEAQDSSLIQEEVLRLLTAKNHNWVRVGDLNQAINETFTTANPKYLRAFINEAQMKPPLETSGRSQRSILAQANRLVNYVISAHPNPMCRDGLVRSYIRLTPPGDSQGNPADDPGRIVYDPQLYSTREEVDVISRLAVKHIQAHPNETVAILTPGNDYGKEFVNRLEDFPVEVVEVLKSTKKARASADVIAAVLDWLSLPLNRKFCLTLFRMLYSEREKGEFYLTETDQEKAAEILEGLEHPEDFFYPLSEDSLRELFDTWGADEILAQTLFRFRYFLKRWLDARFLPVDQLILLIGQDLFHTSDDLCCAGQIGIILSQVVRMNPELSLGSMAAEVRKIASNAGLYAGLRGSDSQFDPNDYPGKIVVTTYHKAKGLEWDQVFLTSCNNYDFPDGNEAQYVNRRYKPKYVCDNLDLQAEILQALKVVSFPEKGLRYRRGDGSREAWLDSVKERLRLLYVGITRARKGLYVSFNSGRYGNTTEANAVMKLRLMNRAER
ncbi:MAG: ATP-dependent helicase [Anaerolineaceae bacterium]|nr:ATP-dependent helicase [Anaerolineaceae bacterium]